MVNKNPRYERALVLSRVIDLKKALRTISPDKRNRYIVERNKEAGYEGETEVALTSLSLFEQLLASTPIKSSGDLSMSLREVLRGPGTESFSEDIAVTAVLLHRASKDLFNTQSPDADHYYNLASIAINKKISTFHVAFNKNVPGWFWDVGPTGEILLSFIEGLSFSNIATSREEVGQYFLDRSSRTPPLQASALPSE